MPNLIKDWPHAPVHRLGNDGVFMVTGATLYKQHLFSGRERLNILEGSLLTLANISGNSKHGLPSQTTITSLLEAIVMQRTFGCFSITCTAKLRAS